MARKRILIVGGVAGGATCAARLRRLCEDCEIIIFEMGSYVSFANCGLPYFIGDVIVDEESCWWQRLNCSKIGLISRFAPERKSFQLIERTKRLQCVI